MTVARHRINSRPTALALALILVSALAACSDSKSSTGTTDTTAPATTDVVPATDSVVPDTVAPTTSTPDTSTSTTVAPAVVTVDPDGIGDAKLGEAPDGVIAYFTTLFGESTSDSDWVDGGSCQAETIRVVQWPNLYTMFADSNAFDASVVDDQQFVFFSYALDFGVYPTNPLATDRGLVLGDTTARLLELYPEATAYDGSLGGRFYRFSDDIVGPNGILQDSPEIVGSIEAGDWPCSNVR